MLSARTCNTLYVCQYLNEIQLTSKANNLLGWKCGQFTSVTLLYFLAYLCVDSTMKEKVSCCQLHFLLISQE